MSDDDPRARNDEQTPSEATDLQATDLQATDLQATELGRRRHPRVSVPLLVQYRFGAVEEPRIDYALNVSQSGLFIASCEPRPVGTRVFVQLTTRDGAHFLQGEGQVVRAEDGGYAIELLGFDEEARRVLDELVQKAREAEGRLEVGIATRRGIRRDGSS